MWNSIKFRAAIYFVHLAPKYAQAQLHFQVLLAQSCCSVCPKLGLLDKVLTFSVVEIVLIEFLEMLILIWTVDHFAIASCVQR